MDKLLKFIIKYCSFLYMDYGFRFKDSEQSESFGNAYIILENNILVLMFVLDRSQLFLDFQSKLIKKKAHKYSLDIIRQFITKDNDYFAELNENNGIFLKDNFEKILQYFSEENLNNTIVELERLIEKRMKKMWS